MIDQKYVELMNLFLDNEITADQKKTLNEYLNTSEEGRKYFNELSKITICLNDAKDILPSENVKKYILNSIDHSRYIKSEKISFSKRISKTLAFFDRKAVLAFGSGAAAIILIFLSMGKLDIQDDSTKDLSGSLTPKNDLLVVYTDEIVLDNDIVKGKIQKEYFENSLNVVFILEASNLSKIELSFDKDYYQFSEIFNTESKNLKFDLQEGELQLNVTGKSAFVVTFNKISDFMPEGEVSLSINGKKL